MMKKVKKSYYNIKFILDLLFKQNNFYFPLKPNKNQTKKYKKYKDIIEKDKKIHINRKIYYQYKKVLEIKVMLNYLKVQIK